MLVRLLGIAVIALLCPTLRAKSITAPQRRDDLSSRLAALEVKVAEMMPRSEIENKLEELEGILFPSEETNVYVSTKYGKIKGLTFKTQGNERYNVFYGINYGKPPTGQHRFAQPRPISPWFPEVKDATSFGNICMQQDTQRFNIAPASEDCLNLNIFAPKPSASVRPLPVMLFIHGGSFRNWDAAYFNYTNLALKGVVVVTINYRLDAFGFLSTQDNIIPGNFGLMDAKLALEFVKEIIGDFGGDASDITLFGSSAGGAMVSQMRLSPLTRGKFQKAIAQSGPGTCNWCSYKPGTAFVPRQIAFALGQLAQCTPAQGTSGTQASQALLDCLRDVPADQLIEAVKNLTTQVYMSAMIFVPVSGDSFGFLPEPPAALAAKTDDIVDIPMIVGWTSEDSSWVVPDPEGDGLTYQEFSNALQMSIGTTYPSDQVPALYQKALVHYNMTVPSGLTPYDIRSVGIDISTDVTMKSFIVKEARQFSKAAAGSGAHVFVYEYRHRPSYSVNPAWQLVTHMDEEGMCLGLPNGPSDLSYPQTSHHDRHVSELMTTWWSNFAKYGTPSPDWPKFGHRQDDQQILVIRPQPEVKQFDDHEPVVLWTGSSGLDE